MKKIIALLFVTLLISSCGSSKNEETPSHSETSPAVTTEETWETPTNTETPAAETEAKTTTEDEKKALPETDNSSSETETKTEDELVDETIQEIDDLFKLLESDDK